MNDADKNTCPFCKRLHEVQQIDNYYIEKRDGRTGETKVIYGAALVRDMYYNGFFCGRTTHDMEQLHYCPTCGVKIQRSDEDESCYCC